MLGRGRPDGTACQAGWSEMPGKRISGNARYPYLARFPELRKI